MKKLYIGIGLILFNLIIEGFNFYVCNNSIGLSNECTFFKANYGISYFLGYNIYSIIGITLITIYFLKKDKMIKPIKLNKKIKKIKKEKLNKKEKNVSSVKKKRYLPKIELKYILIISVIINVTYLTKYTIVMQQNKKYIKTINYLIDDNFVIAEKYINNNELYNSINYNKLMKKINNIPQRTLCHNGPCVYISSKTFCKRFNLKKEECEAIPIDASKYRKAENVGEMILFEDQLPKFPNLMPK